MDRRVKGHKQLLDELKAHTVLGQLVCGVIPANDAVSYFHHHHLSVFNYDPKAYAQMISKLVHQITEAKASAS